VSEPKPKSFEISKRAVWEAWLRVKANKGAAGVDEQSITEFERNLKGNLYKLWNRLSSGSYFPPPVLAVEIPKRDGSPRMLGVPTVADRIAQTVVRWYLEPGVEPIFHPDSYKHRPSLRDSRNAAVPVGTRRDQGVCGSAARRRVDGRRGGRSPRRRELAERRRALVWRSRGPPPPDRSASDALLRVRGG